MNKPIWKKTIFISYAREDKENALLIYNLLKSHGFSPWIDVHDLSPGQQWELEIDKAIKNCDMFVACLSTKSVSKRGFVQSELKKALTVLETIPEDEVFLIPVRLEPCDVPQRLARFQWSDYFSDKGSTDLLRAVYRYLAKDILLAINPELVRIEAGEFSMGSDTSLNKHSRDEEQPTHKVFMSEFFIGRYPVTNLEYQSFLIETRREYSEYKSPAHWRGIRYPKEKEQHPVVNVSWIDADNYCRWLAVKTGKPYRLPTEAEWEKAARGEKGYLYPWGNKWNSRLCNNKEMGLMDTTPIGRFSPKGDSPYGVTDMVGNIWEWCEDWYDENEYKFRQGSSIINPQGPRRGTRRVLRGGSFIDDPELNNCTYRAWSAPAKSTHYYGFRVAVSFAK